ncbi:MAG: hypothetical protein Q7U38_11945 [Methylobacter sp.]|nr:hypothetical protein [Methylobacter sp.]MDP2100805.1 hypothetical protein [Methylobacter sp.]MDP2427076.1 hypothetical protein [Methylobacter sp.]MDP3053054.1 hypothetical protein [Methylobacter sp.]MDP3363251.1 hypothetical protein [Methylobacter sp.]
MKRLLMMALASMLFSGGANANTQLWLSDQPPDKSLLKKMQRSHGGYVYVEDNVYVKQLWLRKGDSLSKSAYAAPVTDDFRVMDTQAKLSEPAVEHGEKSHSIRFKMPDEGFYNAYYTERSVVDNVLNVTTAKAEVLKHSCRLGHNYDRKLVNPNQWVDAPLEIVRLRLPDEDFHTNIHSGAELKFKVLHKGKPAAGAEVKLETQKGWVNTKTADKEGMVTFQVIQDSFPVEADKEKAADKPAKPGDEHADHGQGKKSGHEMRQKDNFLVHAEYTADESGQLNGAPYRQAQYSVTMTGSYMPNVQVDQSRSQALMYAGAGFLTLGGGAYAYRRRRIKPFKEVGFDEH